MVYYFGVLFTIDQFMTFKYFKSFVLFKKIIAKFLLLVCLICLFLLLKFQWECLMDPKDLIKTTGLTNTIQVLPKTFLYKTAPIIRMEAFRIPAVIALATAQREDTFRK